MSRERAPAAFRKCRNGHYSFQDTCRVCGEAAECVVEWREGDCIACGFLCPSYAYGCDSSVPLTFDRVTKIAGNGHSPDGP
jgi:hypothetical protein